MKLNDCITLQGKDNSLLPFRLKDLVELAQEDPKLLDLELRLSDPEGNNLAPVQGACYSEDDDGKKVLWLFGDNH